MTEGKIVSQFCLQVTILPAGKNGVPILPAGKNGVAILPAGKNGTQFCLQAKMAHHFFMFYKLLLEFNFAFLQWHFCLPVVTILPAGKNDNIFSLHNLPVSLEVPFLPSSHDIFAFQ